jgi:hypothetical protein
MFGICATNLEFLEILLSKFCQDFPPHPFPLPHLRGRGEGEGVISLALFGCGYAAVCNRSLISVIRDFMTFPEISI